MGKNLALHPHPPIIEGEERFVPSKGWDEMIKKVIEADSRAENTGFIDLLDIEALRGEFVCQSRVDSIVVPFITAESEKSGDCRQDQNDRQ